MLPWITVKRMSAAVFVSEVPPALSSQGGVPTVSGLPFDCPHRKHGSSTTSLGNSRASERLANHTSGSAPAMATALDNILERASVICR